MPFAVAEAADEPATLPMTPAAMPQQLRPAA
jgi:hypothetical protein